MTTSVDVRVKESYFMLAETDCNGAGLLVQSTEDPIDHYGGGDTENEGRSSGLGRCQWAGLTLT